MSNEEQMGEPTPLNEEELRDASAMLRAAMPPVSFKPGFADRTMARIAAERAVVAPEMQRFAAMQRTFRVLAAAAAIAIVALGAHNTVIARADDTSLFEAALGLQPVSAETLLSSAADTFQ
jgi:hypothetical protein